MHVELLANSEKWSLLESGSVSICVSAEFRVITLLVLNFSLKLSHQLM
jgi:hypothetical protein